MRLPLYLEYGGSIDTKPNSWSGNDCVRFLADHFEQPPKAGDTFVMRKAFSKGNVIEIVGALRKFDLADLGYHKTSETICRFQVNENGAAALNQYISLRKFKEL